MIAVITVISSFKYREKPFVNSKPNLTASVVICGEKSGHKESSKSSVHDRKYDKVGVCTVSKYARVSVIFE